MPFTHSVFGVVSFTTFLSMFSQSSLDVGKSHRVEVVLIKVAWGRGQRKKKNMSFGMAMVTTGTATARDLQHNDTGWKIFAFSTQLSWNVQMQEVNLLVIKVFPRDEWVTVHQVSVQ